MEWFKYGQVAPVSQTSMPPVCEMPLKDGWATPTIVNGRLLSVTGWPTAACADPNADCASPWLTTTTGEPTGPRSSSGVKLRPALSRTPSTSKKSADTVAAPASRGAAPATASAALLSCTPAMPVTLRARDRMPATPSADTPDGLTLTPVAVCRHLPNHTTASDRASETPGCGRHSSQFPTLRIAATGPIESATASSTAIENAGAARSVRPA